MYDGTTVSYGKKSLYTLVPGLSDTDGTDPGDKCDPGGDVKGEVNKIKIWQS